MTEQGTELVTEAGRRLVRAMQAEGRVTGNNGSLTEPIAAIESEARRLALAEGLDVERLARAMAAPSVDYVIHAYSHTTEEQARAIAAEYARLSEEARHEPQ